MEIANITNPLEDFVMVKVGRRWDYWRLIHDVSKQHPSRTLV